MHKYMNIIEKIFTILLSISLLLGISFGNYYYFLFGSDIIKIILLFIIALLCILTIITSIIDIIKFKKFKLTTSIIKTSLIIILLINIYRPYIDHIFIKSLKDNHNCFIYSMDIISQNILLISLFLIILFMLNYKSNKSK